MVELHKGMKTNVRISAYIEIHKIIDAHSSPLSLAARLH